MRKRGIWIDLSNKVVKRSNKNFASSNNKDKENRKKTRKRNEGQFLDINIINKNYIRQINHNESPAFSSYLIFQ